MEEAANEELNAAAPEKPKEATSGTLSLILVDAKLERDTDYMGKQDPFCELQIKE